jgi:hypothetical protein
MNVYMDTGMIVFSSYQFYKMQNFERLERVLGQLDINI